MGIITADTGKYKDLSWKGERVVSTCVQSFFNPRQTVEGGHTTTGRFIEICPVTSSLSHILTVDMTKGDHDKLAILV